MTRKVRVERMLVASVEFEVEVGPDGHVSTEADIEAWALSAADAYSGPSIPEGTNHWVPLHEETNVFLD